MKNKSSGLLSAILLAGLFAVLTRGKSAELWIAPYGADQNPGTSNAPLATLAGAIDRWKKFPRVSPEHFVRLILRDGIFPVTETLQINDTHFSGKNARLSIEAAPGAHPILSGAVLISGWKKTTTEITGLPEKARGKIWAADVPITAGKLLEFRQLWVNNIKAIRAREPNGDELRRLIAWDQTNQSATISSAALAGANKAEGLEMILDQVWEIASLRLATCHIQNSNVVVTFQLPESKIEFGHPWPPIIVNANYQAPFFLVNAIEFLDSPGEWFEDLRAGKIYYWPRAGEDLKRASVFAPVTDTLMRLTGTLENPITHIQFRGLTFAHTTWLRPAEQGHVPLQAGMFLLAAQKLSPKGTPYHRGLDNLAWIGRPPAAVEIKNANHILFEGCKFEHLASAGLDFSGGTSDDLVEGCCFRDLGGNGIQLGKFSDAAVETHVPYQPAEEREICTRENISNNEITDCGNEDWGCVGIGVGYARNISIEHNELFDLPYTAISVGWGWTKMTNALRNNFIFANRIRNIGQRLGDLGGIYTLSAQPGTIVAENVISDIAPSRFAPDPQHWFYLYLDEGSSGITVRDNWCPSEKFLKNANGPGNVWTNNGPQVSETIKQNAGLKPAFQFLRQSSHTSQP